MKRMNNDLFPIVDREQEFQKIYNNTIEKVNYINAKYSETHNGVECEELDSLIEQMNNFVLNLTRVTKLEEYLSFKLLVQKILRLLGECDHDGVIPPIEPELEPVVIKAILQNLNKKLVGELLTAENDYLITSVEYELYKNNTRVEKVTTNSASVTANFTSTEPGSYHFLAKYYWADKFKQIMSNTVVIEEEVVVPPPVDGEFPATLPYSNLWAHTVNSNGNYEITLNNTWGIIDSRLAVYLDGQLSEVLDTTYAAGNKGSAKNVVSTSKFPSNKDLKFVYKVTYVRDEKTNDKVVVYYKSTTGNIEIATPDGGVKYCNYPEWNPEIEYGSATGKIVFYQGFHFKHSGWASKGDSPKTNGDWSPWTMLSTSEEAAINCPGNHMMDSAGTAPNAHLEPMDITKVEGLGTPMEKMHITYTPEWGKWGGRKYTPKISPWNKISHMQYAFVDVIPDYTGNFFTDKDDISHLKRSAADAPIGTSLKVSPNIFDPGAAFSAYGGTNAFMTEYNEMSRKYPYVKPIASLGGWSRSAFFRDAAQPNNIAHFVQRCIDFIREFNMVGIDIDWEFPCNRRDGDLVDSPNDLGSPRAADDEEFLFTNLMQALRVALDKAGEEDGKYYFLSCAIVSGKNHILKSGIGVWHPTCDFISYMTYDVHGAFDSITNHQSYLFQNPSEPSVETNPNGNAMAISDLIKFVTTTYGVPVNKITIGTPFYSRGWSGIFKPTSGWPTSMPGLFVETNIDAASNGTKGCSAPGTMDGGRGAGVLPLHHLNKLIKGENVSVRTLDMNGPANPHAGTTLIGADFNYYYDEAAQVPYLYNEKAGIFYTFEDERSAETKCQWIIDNNLAGVISWDIAMDDYGIDMHGSSATSAYPSLYQADHLLTSVIFDKFKANSLRLNYLNRLARR
ncbi:glycosyl hydrolase family 18 protein [uncultured Cetobacterium sp.]|uniref:glycoside hydrolase family 18 protein n=1 Tax=uncultured Cetobacterium sp. TaxID=527638 RepID=UPI0025E33444|nr:glycosyl hydrolase family 18 protein [uncultured Cetobacterium sp.]